MKTVHRRNQHSAQGNVCWTEKARAARRKEDGKRLSSAFVHVVNHGNHFLNPGDSQRQPRGQNVLLVNMPHLGECLSILEASSLHSQRFHFRVKSLLGNTHTHTPEKEL